MKETLEVRLELTASPHLKGPDSTLRIMWTVVATLLPLVAAAVWFFGPRALAVILLAASRIDRFSLQAYQCIGLT